MRRIPVEERRARLVLRHRLAPSARARDAVSVARSVVALHSTDAVTVFLAILARSEGVAPADIERALYDDRALVRVLAMRRTLWVVPRELLPVVHAAATVGVAATQRRRLERWVLDSEVSTQPAVWLRRAEQEALRLGQKLRPAGATGVGPGPAPPARWRPCRTKPSSSTAARGSCWRTTSTRPSRRSRSPRCCRRSTRPRWAGRSAGGTWGRTRSSCSTRPATLGRRCGGTAGSSAAGARGRRGRSCPSRSKTCR